MSNIAEGLRTDLSSLFNAPVSIDVLNEANQGQQRIVVCQVSYTQHSSESRQSRDISQTAVVLQTPELDLPQFFLMPKMKGLAGTMLRMMGGVGNVEFDDSPRFNSSYRLHGWAEQPVRILFTPQVRDYFSENEGWSVRGHGQQLIVFRRNETVPESERTEFVRSATQILSLLQEGERQLDERTDVRREATSEDLLAATRSMGLAGSIIARQLQKHRVTPDEMDEFLNSSPPRTIPRGMLRQVLGDSLFLVFLGCFFLLGGLIGAAIFLALAPPTAKLIGGLGLGMMSLIGFVVMWFSIKHRQRKLRTLTRGELKEGTILDVRTTGVVVNNQVRHVATVEYQAAGSPQKATCNLYGFAATKAREKLDREEPVRILVDPQDPHHMISPDLLAVFDGLSV